LKIIFNADPKPFVAVFWNKADYFDQMMLDINKSGRSKSNKFNVIYQVEINKFNGQYLPQMLLLHLSLNGEE
jgi:hypothetical protein